MPVQDIKLSPTTGLYFKWLPGQILLALSIMSALYLPCKQSHQFLPLLLLFLYFPVIRSQELKENGNINVRLQILEKCSSRIQKISLQTDIIYHCADY